MLLQFGDELMLELENRQVLAGHRIERSNVQPRSAMLPWGTAFNSTADETRGGGPNFLRNASPVGQAFWLLDKKDEVKEEYRRIHQATLQFAAGVTGFDRECDESRKNP